MNFLIQNCMWFDVPVCSSCICATSAVRSSSGSPNSGDRSGSGYGYRQTIGGTGCHYKREGFVFFYLKHALIFFFKLSDFIYRSGTVNLNTVNSKFHLIRSYCEIFFYYFPNISCLKCTVNSNFHLIRSKTLLRNDLEITVLNLYLDKLDEYDLMHEYDLIRVWYKYTVVQWLEWLIAKQVIWVQSLVKSLIFLKILFCWVHIISRELWEKLKHSTDSNHLLCCCCCIRVFL